MIGLFMLRSKKNSRYLQFIQIVQLPYVCLYVCADIDKHNDKGEHVKWRVKIDSHEFNEDNNADK